MAVNQTIRAAAQAGAGDRVRVTMEPDTAKRVVKVPAYLKKGLLAARQDKVFTALSYSHRKEYVDWIRGGEEAGDAGGDGSKSVWRCWPNGSGRRPDGSLPYGSLQEKIAIVLLLRDSQGSNVDL